MKEKSCPVELIQAASLISKKNFDEAQKILKNFEPQSIISDICKRVLLYPNEYTDNLFIEHLFDETKQINYFDIVLRSVPCVTDTTQITLQIMKDFYAKAINSFTHINIGIGKGYFEKQLLTELAKNENSKNLKEIKIIGLDIDLSSLQASEQNIKEAATLFSKETTIEFIPICQFAENISEIFWLELTKKTKGILGITSAFTIHHLQKNEDRVNLISNLAKCNPQLFTLIEPDSDHFTPYIPDRLVNCWNLFGTIFDMADIMKLSEEEEKAIKYIFFGREIENILINDEDLRYEKHDISKHWSTRLKEAGLKPINISNYKSTHPLLNFEYNIEGVLTAEYNKTPLVSILAFSK